MAFGHRAASRLVPLRGNDPLSQGAAVTVHPPDLMRKLSKKIDQGKAVQLTPAELDLLVECGAFDRVCEAATEFQRKQCRERSARNRSTREALSGSTLGMAGTT